MAFGSESFEFVFQAKFFFFQSRDTHFVPTGMGHFGFDQFLYSPVFVCDFSDMRTLRPSILPLLGMLRAKN